MSQESTSILWGCCAVDEGDTDYVLCTLCNLAYHFDCLGSTITDEKWKCLMCSGKKSCLDSTMIDTPRGSAANPRDNVTTRSTKRPAISSPIDERASVTRDDVREVIKEVFKSEMGTLITKINNNFTTMMSREIGGLKSEITELKESMNFINLQYEEFKDQHQSALKSVEELRLENTNLRSTLIHLNGRVDQLEQQARLNNVELQCIPEKKSENLVNIVSSLCKVVNCTVKPENIVKCTRIAKLDPTGVRPRSIILQLSSPIVRDQFLASVKNYNKTKKPEDKLNTSHIGLNCEKKPIYVVEHLTPSNKALHAAARLRAKERKYKYVWIRNGKIFVRKADDSDFIIVKDASSLDRIV